MRRINIFDMFSPRFLCFLFKITNSWQACKHYLRKTCRKYLIRRKIAMKWVYAWWSKALRTLISVSNYGT